VPGDKSISHRSLMLGALAEGPSRVLGLLRADDVMATWAALTACGVELREDGDAVWVGGGGLREPSHVLDCGNSGTSIRLLCGMLAAVPGLSVLTGDASLSRRPMGRVIAPLRAMGATIDARASGRLPPVVIRGGPLHAAEHRLEVASAQVKSAVLLAGLGCGARVIEPRRSRDHTERMLRAMGAQLEVEPDGALSLAPSALRGITIDVPGDLSSAAFLLVAASIVDGSDLTLTGTGVNPTRSGVLDVLAMMGADIERADEEGDGVEPRATLRVRSAALRGARIDGELALRAIDELPVLAIAAAFAQGETVIADASELRVKESDRVASVAAGLRAMGASVEERPDGMVIAGGGLRGGGVVDAGHDHRLAMAFTVAGLAAPAGVEVLGEASVRTSWPTFFETLDRLTGEG
jgi:3-phosphoshikimate 1-carboxyvinyltransferase